MLRSSSRSLSGKTRDQTHPKHRIKNWFLAPYGATYFKHKFEIPYVQMDKKELFHCPETSKITGKQVDWMYGEPKSGLEFRDTFGPNTIELTGLPMRITPEQLQERLRQWFSKFGGHVEQVRVLPHSHDPYQTCGTGYITLSNRRAVFRAIKTPLKLSHSMKGATIHMKSLDNDKKSDRNIIPRAEWHNRQLIEIANQLHERLSQNFAMPMKLDENLIDALRLTEKRFDKISAISNDPVVINSVRRRTITDPADTAVWSRFGTWEQFLTYKELSELFIVFQAPAENLMMDRDQNDGNKEMKTSDEDKEEKNKEDDRDEISLEENLEEEKKKSAFDGFEETTEELKKEKKVRLSQKEKRAMIAAELAEAIGKKEKEETGDYSIWQHHLDLMDIIDSEESQIKKELIKNEIQKNEEVSKQKRRRITLGESESSSVSRLSDSLSKGQNESSSSSQLDSFKHYEFEPHSWYVSARTLTPEKKEALLYRIKMSLDMKLREDLKPHWRAHTVVPLPEYTHRNIQLWLHKPKLPWKVQFQSRYSSCMFDPRDIYRIKVRLARNKKREQFRAPKKAERKEKRQQMLEKRESEIQEWVSKRAEFRKLELEMQSGQQGVIRAGVNEDKYRSKSLINSDGNSLDPFLNERLEEMRLVQYMKDRKGTIARNYVINGMEKERIIDENLVGYPILPIIQKAHDQMLMERDGRKVRN